ncbi:MAG: DUF503 domain-containing protein [Deltaproteobacteria bacterium]|nr:MAG: DUF503 domain-containing protein [Deltaproteobacteria bacterium]
MVVGICRLTFHLPGVRSLKEKRQIVRKLCERTRQRFHISIAEVDSQDRHQEAVIGIALVSGEARVLESFMEQIVQAIEMMNLAPLTDRQWELVHYNDEFASDNFSEWEDEFGEEDDSFSSKANDPWAYMDSWSEPPLSEESESSNHSPSSGRRRKKGRS